MAFHPFSPEVQNAAFGIINTEYPPSPSDETGEGSPWAIPDQFLPLDWAGVKDCIASAPSSHGTYHFETISGLANMPAEIQCMVFAQMEASNAGNPHICFPTFEHPLLPGIMELGPKKSTDWIYKPSPLADEDTALLQDAYKHWYYSTHDISLGTDKRRFVWYWDDEERGDDFQFRTQHGAQCATSWIGAQAPAEPVQWTEGPVCRLGTFVPDEIEVFLRSLTTITAPYVRKLELLLPASSAILLFAPITVSRLLRLQLDVPASRQTLTDPFAFQHLIEMRSRLHAMRLSSLTVRIQPHTCCWDQEADWLSSPCETREIANHYLPDIRWIEKCARETMTAARFDISFGPGDEPLTLNQEVLRLIDNERTPIGGALVAPTTKALRASHTKVNSAPEQVSWEILTAHTELFIRHDAGGSRKYRVPMMKGMPMEQLTRIAKTRLDADNAVLEMRRQRLGVYLRTSAPPQQDLDTEENTNPDTEYNTNDDTEIDIDYDTDSDIRSLFEADSSHEDDEDVPEEPEDQKEYEGVEADQDSDNPDLQVDQYAYIGQVWGPAESARLVQERCRVVDDVFVDCWRNWEMHGYMEKPTEGDEVALGDGAVELWDSFMAIGM